MEELRTGLHEWVKKYNEQWIVGLHGYLSPAQVVISGRLMKGSMNKGFRESTKSMAVLFFRDLTELEFFPLSLFLNCGFPCG